MANRLANVQFLVLDDESIPHGALALILTPIFVLLLEAVFASIVIPANPHSHFATFDHHLGHILNALLETIRFIWDALLETIRLWGRVLARCGLWEKAQEGIGAEEGQGVVVVE